LEQFTGCVPFGDATSTLDYGDDARPLNNVVYKAAYRQKT